MRENLTRKERLGKRSHLEKVFARGSVKKCYGAKIVFLENSLPYSRFAITLPRKFGNAVERNYTKRIFREFYRKHKTMLERSCDMVFVAYAGEFTFKERFSQFSQLLKRAKLVQ